jgi:hypothetical protein
MTLKGKTLNNNKKAIIKKESLPPATINAGIKEGLEEGVDREDLLIPRSSLLQALSPAVTEGIEGCKSGTVVNSITNTKLPEEFIPLFLFVEFIKFNPRDKKDENFDPAYEPGQLIWKIKDRNDPRIKETKFGEDGAKPTAQKTINFLSYFPGEPMPIVVSFSKTSYKAGKKLLSLVSFAEEKEIYARKYKLQVKQADKEGIKYFVLDVTQAGKCNDKEFAIAKTLYTRFRGKELQVHDTDAKLKEEEAE